MPRLRCKLREHLQDWKADIGPAWTTFLGGVGPAYGAVCEGLTIQPNEKIWPGPKNAQSAPSGAHVFRAFENLPPSEVKVVIVGQDPYPKYTQATGRAFEQGDLRENCDTWMPPQGVRVTRSLQNIVKQLVEYRCPPSDRGHIKWPEIKRCLAQDESWLPNPTELFCHWHLQKILMLNMALTFTKSNSGSNSNSGHHKHQVCGHFPLWKPFVTAVLRELARDNSVLFMFWGKESFKFLSSDVGFSEGDPHIILRAHPRTNAFMNGENVFCEADNFLNNNNTQIEWLPS